MSKAKKIFQTTDYALFERDRENRQGDIKKHKKLFRSMEKYGFIPDFPIVCVTDKKTGKFRIREGQHRLLVAEALGLPVYYTLADVEFDIAEINCTGVRWNIRDFAERFANNGSHVYRQGLDFADKHRLTVSTAFALLSGTTNFTNVKADFDAGDFKIKDREWAEAVMALYTPIIELTGQTRRDVLLLACMAVCRVEGFDAKRLLHGIKQNTNLFRHFSTRDEYLRVFQECYNYGRQKKTCVPLEFEAARAMQDRNPSGKPPKPRGDEPAR